MVTASAWFAQTAITQQSGLAVAENVPTTIWNSVRDAVSGDDLTRGVLAVNAYMFDGTNHDRARGDTTNGLDVDVTRVGGTVTVDNGGTFIVQKDTSGTSFFAITDTAIAQVSQNFAFGFTSKKVQVTALVALGVCVDWIGGTAVCPALDTAGDDVIAAGTTVVLDDYAVTSISVIAPAAETNTVIIRAWE